VNNLLKNYNVMEMFHTIQGEGYYSGTSAFFIRLGGCDVGCHWCDVKDSWPVDAHPMLEIDKIVSSAKASGAKVAVITGGEPTMHDLSQLTKHLNQEGIDTHIETSGTNELTGQWNWVTYSPKKFKAPVSRFAKLASELKVVVYNKSDLKFAEEHAKMVGKNCLLYLQPEWDKKETAMPLIIDFIKANPRWRVSLQAHKYLQIP
jgi:7-carboxy-7-deazaguanine synthase